MIEIPVWIVSGLAGYVMGIVSIFVFVAFYNRARKKKLCTEIREVTADMPDTLFKKEFVQ